MNPTFRVSSGLIDPKHLQRMGAALKVFLWCVDHQTGEDGLVLYGGPVKTSKIARAIGICVRVARKYIARLVRAGYLKVKRTGHGLRIEVANQKKWRSPRADQNSRSERIKTAALSGSNVPIAESPERIKRADHIKIERARDLHLKRATTRSTGEAGISETPRDPASAPSIDSTQNPEAGFGPPFTPEWAAATRADLERKGWRCCASCVTGWANPETKLCDDCERRPRLVPQPGTAA